MKYRQWLQSQFLLEISSSVGGEFALQKQVKYRLRCCLNREPVQNRARGLRQGLIKRKHVEIRYVYCNLQFEWSGTAAIFSHKLPFSSVKIIGPEGMIRHIADQKNNRKSHHNFCSISTCFVLRILCPFRYRPRSFYKMTGGYDISEGNHTQEAHRIPRVKK